MWWPHSLGSWINLFTKISTVAAAKKANSWHSLLCPLHNGSRNRPHHRHHVFNKRELSKIMLYFSRFFFFTFYSMKFQQGHSTLQYRYVPTQPLYVLFHQTAATALTEKFLNIIDELVHCSLVVWVPGMLRNTFAKKEKAEFTAKSLLRIENYWRRHWEPRQQER